MHSLILLMTLRHRRCSSQHFVVFSDEVRLILQYKYSVAS